MFQGLIIKCKYYSRFIFILELHELLSICMILFLVILFSIGLGFKSIVPTIQHLLNTAGIIEKTMFSSLILLLIGIRLFSKLHFRTNLICLVRILASFFVMLVSFEAIIYYIQLRKLSIWDSTLQDIDRVLLFGRQAGEWLDVIHSVFITNLLSVAYLSWFILTYFAILLLLLYSKKAVIEYATSALLTFYVGYIGYILIPAYGPVYTFHFPTQLSGVTAFLLTKIHPAADAFPSLHTGISVVMCIVVSKYCKGFWAWFYTIMMLLIIFSTLYLRIHYLIDVIFGVLLAFCTVLLCPKVLVLWEARQTYVLSTIHNHLTAKIESRQTLNQ